MKQFCCGDVVPGCNAQFQGSNEEEVLNAVAQHASQHHGMVEIPVAVLTQVRSMIRDSPAA